MMCVGFELGAVEGKALRTATVPSGLCPFKAQVSSSKAQQEDLRVRATRHAACPGPGAQVSPQALPYS